MRLQQSQMSQRFPPGRTGHRIHAELKRGHPTTCGRSYLLLHLFGRLGVSNRTLMFSADLLNCIGLALMSQIEVSRPKVGMEKTSVQSLGVHLCCSLAMTSVSQDLPRSAKYENVLRGCTTASPSIFHSRLCVTGSLATPELRKLDWWHPVGSKHVQTILELWLK